MRTYNESSRFAAKVYFAVFATASLLAGVLQHAVSNLQAYL
jgi:hypothetical protein